MLNFFLRNLKLPHQIPGKIFSKIEFYLSKKNMIKTFTQTNKINYLKD